MMRFIRLVFPRKPLKAACLLLVASLIFVIICVLNSKNGIKLPPVGNDEAAMASEKLLLSTTANPHLATEARISRIALASVICGRDSGQLQQLVTMLKSLLLTTRDVAVLEVHIIADSQDIYSDVSEVTATWPPTFRSSLRLEFHQVWYPEDRLWMKAYRTPCTTERLYLPKILNGTDAVIYIDTDTLFLNSASQLWDQFATMNSSQLIGMVAEHEDPSGGYYNSRINKIPFFGKLGLNAGVMLVNLTRARSLNNGDWIEAMHMIYDKFQNAPLHFADQDVLNIFFHFNPDKLLEVSCDWNYRTDHCQSKKNTCKKVAQSGVSLLHGNRGVFLNSDDYTFKAVYDAFNKFNWAEDVKGTLLGSLKKLLDFSVNSLCGANPEIFTYQLERNLM